MLTTKLNMYDIITMFDINTNNVLVILDRLSMKTLKRNLEKNNRWKVSYVSGSNFNQNKEKILCAQFTNQLVLPTMYLTSVKHHKTSCTLCTANPFNYHIQIRGFKTKRSINIEFEKNASFLNRFRNRLGQLSDTVRLFFIYTKKILCALQINSLFYRMQDGILKIKIQLHLDLCSVKIIVKSLQRNIKKLQQLL